MAPLPIRKQKKNALETKNRIPGEILCLSLRCVRRAFFAHENRGMLYHGPSGGGVHISHHLETYVLEVTIILLFFSCVSLMNMIKSNTAQCNVYFNG